MTGISVNALQLWEKGQASPHYTSWRKLDLFMKNYEKTVDHYTTVVV